MHQDNALIRNNIKKSDNDEELICSIVTFLVYHEGCIKIGSQRSNSLPAEKI